MFTHREEFSSFNVAIERLPIIFKSPACRLKLKVGGSTPLLTLTHMYVCAAQERVNIYMFSL